MPRFEKVNEEEEKVKKLQEEIVKFLKEIDLILRVTKTIPSLNYTKFDPYLFMLWRKK